MVTLLCCLIVFLLLPDLGRAQASRSKLEERRKSLLKEIANTNRLLSNTRRSKEATLERYYTLQKQIKRREELIHTLQEEIQLSDKSIDRANEVVAALSEDVGRLQKEYARMIRHAYRMKLTKNALLFLFSSDSFNDAFRRWHYLKQYDNYRQKQARLILETQKTLTDKAKQLEKKKQDKEALLLSEISQRNILTRERDDSDRLLKKLKSDEQKLAEDLKAKQQAHENLNKAIEKAIATEMAKKRKAARRLKKTAPAGKVPDADATLNALSSNFYQNKGKLPWPVRNGIITKKFGRQTHPILKKVLITNNGIDIKTEQSANVRAVFSGEVTWLQFIPGNNYMVMLRHGNYFTVYSNLEEVAVNRGQQVKTGDTLGKVGIDRVSNQPELHFEVWKEKNRQNPTPWLLRTQ